MWSWDPGLSRRYWTPTPYWKLSVRNFVAGPAFWGREWVSSLSALVPHLSFPPRMNCLEFLRSVNQAVRRPCKGVAFWWFDTAGWPVYVGQFPGGGGSTSRRGLHHHSPQGGHILYSPWGAGSCLHLGGGVMFSKLVQGGRRTHSVCTASCCNSILNENERWVWLVHCLQATRRLCATTTVRASANT